MAREVSLSVNHKPIEMIPFVEDYVANVAEAVVQSLRGAAATEELLLLVENGAVTVHQNGGELPVNEFVTAIIQNTVLDTLATGKGSQGVEALQNVETGSGLLRKRFLISTEKVGEMVLLRIDDVSDA